MSEIIVPIGILSNPTIANMIATARAHYFSVQRPHAIKKSMRLMIRKTAPSHVRVAPPNPKPSNFPPSDG